MVVIILQIWQIQSSRPPFEGRPDILPSFGVHLCERRPFNHFFPVGLFVLSV